MNWGKWIVVSFVLFAAFIATIVAVCLNHDVNLVSREYYRDDLDFQKQLVRKNNTASLINQPEIKLTEHQLQVSFPEKVSIESGVIKLFRPSNDKLDQDFILQPSEESTLVFTLKPLDRGAYRIKMTWRMEEKEYYLEKFVVL